MSKPVPKKYLPKGLPIIYEDIDLIVVDKRAGLLTVSSSREQQKTAFQLLNDYVQKGNPKSKKRVFVVHRLDKETSGILVFAKNEKAKDFLQENWQEFEKTYYAVVEGKMKASAGLITSYLAENRAYKMYSVSDSNKGKFAQTEYQVIRESKNFSLLKVRLLTGRKNQIRVHLSDEGCPIVGDQKYGAHFSVNKPLALQAAKLTLKHPHSKEILTFELLTPPAWNVLLK